MLLLFVSLFSFLVVSFSVLLSLFHFLFHIVSYHVLLCVCLQFLWCSIVEFVCCYDMILVLVPENTLW